MELIAPVTLEDAEQRKYVFRPAPDITALESVLLSQLFIKLLLNRSGTLPNWMAYVEECGLWRHFIAPMLAAETLEAQTPKRVTIVADDGRLLEILEGMPIPEGYTLLPKDTGGVIAR